MPFNLVFGISGNVPKELGSYVEVLRETVTNIYNLTRNASDRYNLRANSTGFNEEDLGESLHVLMRFRNMLGQQ